jgi:hypothetical protein
VEFIQREGFLTAGQLRALVDAGLVPPDTVLTFRRHWDGRGGEYESNVARAAVLQEGHLLLTSSLPPGPRWSDDDELDRMFEEAGLKPTPAAEDSEVVRRPADEDEDEA